MNEMPVVIREWGWMIFIAVTCLNGLIFRFKVRKHILENPGLEPGYNMLIRGLVIWGNIPWVIMGTGIMSGSVPSFFHYFNPRGGNPFVLAFFGSIFLLWILGTYWLFFRRGAEMLMEHPGLINFDTRNPAVIKLIWCVCLAGGVLAVTMMFMQKIPITLE